MRRRFPDQREGLLYLTEGGSETEIMYKFGHELPSFAMFTLLDNPQAVADMKGMFERYLDTAARHGFAALMGGLARRYPHIDVWGGRCGTWETHLGEIAGKVSAVRGARFN